MSREMPGSKCPLIVMPGIFELPIPYQSRWCKLDDVCRIIPDLTRAVGVELFSTPEELVSRFAILTRPVRQPKNSTIRVKKKLIFRYSLDGKSLGAKDIPLVNRDERDLNSIPKR